MALPALALLLFCTLILVAYGVRVGLRGRVRYERLDRTEGSGLVPRWAVEAFYWALQAPGRVLLRAKVSPDAITYLALALSLASLPLIARGRLVEAGLCVALGGAFDVLDGMVARATGQASAAGAVLDSVTDRVADGAPFVGLALLYRGGAATLLVPLSALMASFVLSYARARAEVHGLRLPDGPMRRHERIVYLVAALVPGSWVPPSPALPGVPYPGTLIGVGAVAVGAAVGAVVLVARIRAALGQVGRVERAGRDSRAGQAGQAENSRSLPPAC